MSSVKECHEGVMLLLLHHVVCCSVAQTCPTLGDSLDCSIPGPLSLTVSLSLPEFMSIASVMLSSHLVLCHPLVLLRSIFPTSGSFPICWLFASGDQNAGTSGVASVLPMNIQGWFPLRLTGLISLLSKGLSRVFSSTTVQRHQFFSALPSFWSSSHNRTWPQERP